MLAYSVKFGLGKTRQESELYDRWWLYCGTPVCKHLQFCITLQYCRSRLLGLASRICCSLFTQSSVFFTICVGIGTDIHRMNLRNVSESAAATYRIRGNLSHMMLQRSRSYTGATIPDLPIMFIRGVAVMAQRCVSMTVQCHDAVTVGGRYRRAGGWYWSVRLLALDPLL